MTKIRTLLPAGLALLFILISFALSGQTKLRLLAGDFLIPDNPESIAMYIGQNQPDIVQGRYYRLVTFSGPLRQQDQDALNAAGFSLLQYLPDRTYIVSVQATSSSAQPLLNAGAVHAMPLDRSVRLHPDLVSGMYPTWALPDNDHIDLHLTFHSDIAPSAIDPLLTSAGLRTIEGYHFEHLRTVRVPRSAIDMVGSLPFLSWVAAIGPPDEPENYTGKTLHRSNVLSSQYATGRKYDGTGVNVMLQDDGVIGPHIDYQGRIVQQTISYNYGDHGDHVAGTIMGAGNLDPTTQGMAPGADIHVYGASPTYPGFANAVSHYYQFNIRISSTSYSNGCNEYTALTRTMDEQMFSLPSMMHVFSAGNNGTANCGYGAGPGWGNITGGHKMAKNVISVANLDFKDALSSSSSRGPGHDGRIKPEVSAKGSDVNSTTNPNLYTVKSGTSMSCPGTSGTLAQLYHAFTAVNNGQEPAGALMKAVLMNSCDDIDNPGPDFKTGWGRINALRAVRTIESHWHMSDSITQGDTNDHTIQVPGQVRQLRVMLYWHDPAAFAGVSKALINDLDARLYDPLSALHMPWSPDPTPSPVILNTPSGKGIDSINNVEQIVIDYPVQGNFHLHVLGKDIPTGPQGYYVVYEFLFDEVKVTYPIGGEAFEPYEAIVIRWDAVGDTVPFTLEYSVDNGMTWSVIASSISGSRRYQNWTVPNIPTGKAMIRVSQGSRQSISEAPFNIMGIPSGLEITWACKDTFQLAWDSVPGAESYVVYKLGSKYMDTVGWTTDTYFDIGGIGSNETHWVSVSAQGAEAAKGRRAVAIEKIPGVWDCVFSHDLTLEVLSPAPGHHPQCIDHSTVPVKVLIRNVGKTTMSNVPVSYNLGSVNPVFETYTGSIPAGGAVEHTFAVPVNLNAPATYYLNATLSHPADSNSFNNTVTSKVKVVSSSPMTQGSVQDFDALSLCSVLSDCEGISCNLGNGWVNEANNDLDDIDWRVVQGSTPSSGTGPLGDHTSSSGSGNFIYLEASGDCYEREAILVSPCLDLTQMSTPVLDFWYNLNGADMGSLHVDLMHEAEWIEDVIPPIVGNQGPDWKKAVIDLSTYAGGFAVVRFRGYTGDGNLSDMAIDDILLAEATSVPEHPSVLLGLRFFPNPARDEVTVSFLLDPMETAILRILDLTGKTLAEASVQGTGRVTYPMSLLSLPQGTYILRVETRAAVAHEKLQIIR